jgi:hypothetical protein
MRSVTTYHNWMAVDWQGGRKPPLPSYLCGRVPPDVARDVSRLKLSSHWLKVETGRWHRVPRGERVCGMCGVGAVQDEKHVLLECEATSDIRVRYAGVIEEAGGDMRKLMTCPQDRAAWFIADCLRRVHSFNQFEMVDIDQNN